ncbi:HSP 20 [Gracilaria domingensis]|nr:HSP 20 [Gracilaria domingensis]
MARRPHAAAARRRTPVARRRHVRRQLAVARAAQPVRAALARRAALAEALGHAAHHRAGVPPPGEPGRPLRAGGAARRAQAAHLAGNSRRPSCAVCQAISRQQARAAARRRAGGAAVCRGC